MDRRDARTRCADRGSQHLHLLPRTPGGPTPWAAGVTRLFAEAIDADLEGAHAQAARLAATMGLDT